MRGARTSHVRALPPIMYGTAWKEDRTQALVLEAIATGFRAFDTANQRKHYVEEEVGAAVRTAIVTGTVTREDLSLSSPCRTIIRCGSLPDSRCQAHQVVRGPSQEAVWIARVSGNSKLL
jgi:hypothetical protein